MPLPPKDLNSISSLVQIVQDLRGPEGCPWDKEQNHATLAPYAIEETFEMIEALESGSDEDFCDELGDVLFQVVIHAQLAKERGAFDFQAIVKAISEKIVRRHPHVFSNTVVTGTADVIENWDTIKALEKANSGKKADHLNLSQKIFKVPRNLPSLQAAYKIGEKTEKYKFDWSHSTQVLAQVKEEIAELEAALNDSASLETFENIEHELGDILFSVAQLCRHLKIEPETALRKTNHRFQSRFIGMLSELNQNQSFNSESVELLLQRFISKSVDEKEAFWKNAKKNF